MTLIRRLIEPLSSSYTLAHKIEELFNIPKTCNCAEHGYTDECSGEIELHHKDGNPFNNSPGNLGNLCRKHHGRADDEHVVVNVVELYKRCVDESGFADEDKKHAVMVSIYESLVSGGLYIALAMNIYEKRYRND